MNRLEDVVEYVRVPDGDPRLEGASLGEVKVTGTIAFVAESDWITFLAMIGERCGIKDCATKLKMGLE